MAISFLWALYLTASLILFATLHKSDGSLAANGANVCSRSQSFSQTYKRSYKMSWTKVSTYSCGWWGMNRCHSYRTVYGVAYKVATRQAYKAQYLCCPGWKEQGRSCPIAICKDACINGTCSKPDSCSCNAGFSGKTCDTAICKDGCINGTCSKPDTCSCDAGFYGKACDTECPSHKWGPHCRHDCMCQNGAKCDSRNGSCSCTPGWQGMLCEKPCDQGYYGDKCKKQCRCLNGGPCDPVTGKQCCPVNCVVGRWSSWGSCNARCESNGQQTRSRRVTTAASCKGTPCPTLTQTKSCRGPCCPRDCQVSSWSAWGSCSAPPGRCSTNSGTRKRTRRVTSYPSCGGSSCPTLTHTPQCTPVPIPCKMNAWSSWSACSPSNGKCGAGTQYQTRTVATQPYCSPACPATRQTRSCTHSCCPRDCAVSSWSSWSACSNTCGTGTKTRTRRITVQQYCNGRACPTLKDTTRCSQYNNRDCVMSSWSSWSICNNGCGSGQSTRTRRIISPAVCRGKACGARAESRQCTDYRENRDCVVNSWGSWGVCSEKCAVGTKQRTRTVKISKRCRGRDCPALRETSQCGTPNNGCLHKCTNGVCSCNAGYYLASNKKNCIAKDCNMPIPSYCAPGTSLGSTCKHANVTCPGGKTTYPVTCSLGCPQYYSIKGASTITCQTSGQWTSYASSYCRRNNDPPSQITLSGAAIVPENQPRGTKIGTFSTVDPNTKDKHTYSIVSGGSGKFELRGADLLTLTTFNYETSPNRFTLVVRSTDNGSPPMRLDKTFTISVTNVNEKPTAIQLSSNTVDENSGVNTEVGLLSTADPDNGQSYSYTLLDGAGGRFKIQGNRVKVAKSNRNCLLNGGSQCYLNFESVSSYPIRVRSVDSGSPSQSINASFNILLNDVNDQPRGLKLSNYKVKENAPINFKIGNLSASDEDKGQKLNFSLVDDDAGRFASDSRGVLYKAKSTDYETSKVHHIVAKVTDDGNPSLSMTKLFSISVLDVNEAPVSIVLSSSSVKENSKPGTLVGTLMATDTDAVQNLTFKLDDDAGGKFSLQSNSSCQSISPNGTRCTTELLVSGDINYEDTSSLDILVRVTDYKGLFRTQMFNVTVIDVNDPPTNVTLDGSVSALIPENSKGVQVDSLITEDEDQGQNFTYVLINNPGGNFEIKGDKLFTSISAKLDYESSTSHQFTVKSTDDGNPPLSVQVSLVINLQDVNEKPTKITLSNRSVQENKPTGTLVGELTVSDPDRQQSHVCSLTDSANGKVALSKNQLTVGSAGVNYEDESSLNVKVLCRDPGGLAVEDTFVILVQDVNEAPTSISLSNDKVQENQKGGTVVAQIIVTDPDNEKNRVQSFTLSISSSDPNLPFQIQNNSLVTKRPLDYENSAQWLVRVTAKDDGIPSLSRTQAFSIQVIDVNDAPNGMVLSSSDVNENSDENTLVGSLTAVDQDTLQNHNFQLLNSASGRFKIDGNEIKVAISNKQCLSQGGSSCLLNYEKQKSHIIRVQTTDDGSSQLSYEENFRIDVRDINDMPRDLQLSNNQVKEDAKINTLIGRLTSRDEDASQSATYSLSNDDSGRFKVDPHGRLYTAKIINHETQKRHVIRAMVKDNGNPPMKMEKSFTIEILDVNEAPSRTNITSQGGQLSFPDGHAQIRENSASGTKIGTLEAFDYDAEQNLTFDLDDDAGGKFKLASRANCQSITNIPGVNTKCTTDLLVNGSLDYEVSTEYSLIVRVTDNNGTFMIQRLKIAVVDQNDAPENVTLGGSNAASVHENANGAFVGELVTSDQDVGQTHTYKLLNSARGKFVILNNKLYVSSSANLDYETQSQFTVRIQSEDNGSPPLSLAKDFKISIIDVNEAPVNITLSPANIAENSAPGTVIGQLNVTDPDNYGSRGAWQSHNCQVIGNQVGKFTVQTNSLVVGNPNLDYERASLMLVQVRCSDSGSPPLSLAKVLSVTVDDVNEAPTGISLSSDVIAENRSPMLIGFFSTADPDNSNQPTKKQTFIYTLMGDKVRLPFLIDGDALNTTRRLDFEAQSSWNITIKSTDSGSPALSLIKTFQISVVDVNEKPFNITLSNTVINENPPRDALVGTVFAGDPDFNQTLVYTLIDGAGGRFKLDGNKLKVALSNDDCLKIGGDFCKLNYEKQRNHTVSMRATDNGNPPQSTETSLSIRLIDVNDRPRNLKLSSNKVKENAAIGTKIGLFSATDEDSSQTLQFSLVDIDGGRFAVDSSGYLLKAKGTDYETKKVHKIVAHVRDSGNPPLEMEKAFTIEVLDVNEAPININITSQGGQLSFPEGHARIRENSAIGTKIGTLEALDHDAVQSLTFNLDDDAGGKFKLGSRASCQSISSIPGVNTKCKTDLTLNGSLDYEVTIEYSLTVRVTDNKTSFTTQQFKITVVDKNDAPENVTLGGSNAASVHENANGAFVGELVTSDQDIGQTHTYNLLNSARGKFVILNNKVYVASSANLDYEAQSQFTVRIQSVDSGSPPLSLAKDFKVTIIDVNEAPVNISLSPANIAENSSPGTVIGQLNVTDPDNYGSRGLWQSHNCQVIRSEVGNFRVQTNLLVIGSTNLDYEHAALILVQVRCSDSGSPPLSLVKVLSVTVDDVNEAPTRISLSNDVTAENQSPMLIGFFSTADPDNANQMTNRQTFTYTLMGNTAGLPFLIDGDAFNSTTSLDFEAQSSWNITVRSTDSGSPALSLINTFQISVVDVNEKPFNISLSNAVINENSPQDALVGTVSARDSDFNQTLIYTLTNGGGGRFKLDGNKLKVALSNDNCFKNGGDFCKLNYEKQRSYTVSMRATDNGNPPQSAETSKSITLIDVNDQPRDLKLSSNTVKENAAIGTKIGQFSATDEDSSQTLRFSLVDSDSGRFAVDSSGYLLKAKKTNYETNKVHKIVARVGDSGNPPLEMEKSFTIEVLDVNEAPININITSQGGLLSFPDGHAQIRENSASGTKIGTLEAFDYDAVQNLTFNLDDDASGEFKLASRANCQSITNIPGVNTKCTTDLLVNGSLDYEVFTEYSLIVRVTDNKGTFMIQRLKITVVDQNDAPENVTLGGSNAASVNENANGAFVGELVTSDQDVGQTHTYKLLNSARGKFVILNNKLYVSSSANLDYEAQSQFTVRIQSEDNGSPPLSLAKDFKISIIDVNEAPVNITLSPANIAENSAAGTVIGQLDVTDPDNYGSRGAWQSHNCQVIGKQVGKFTVQTNSLVVGNGNLDYEHAALILVQVRCSDSGSPPLSLAKVLSITVDDVNEAPTGISLSSDAIAENQSPMLIGLFSTADPDNANQQTNRQTFTYTLMGNTAGLPFIIDGDVLNSTRSLDFEAHSSWNMTVKTVDSGDPALSLIKTFQISVVDVNEKPFNITLSNTVINENPPRDAPIGTVFAGDPDFNQTLVYTLINGAGGRFKLVGNKLKVALSNDDCLKVGGNFCKLNYERQNTYKVSVRATDNGNPPQSTEAFLSITLIDVNDRPRNLKLYSNMVKENATIGTKVGQFSATDEDTSQTLQFALIDSDGGRFAVDSSGYLLKAKGTDYETDKVHKIVAQVRDSGNPPLEINKTFIVVVENINEAPINISLTPESGQQSFPDNIPKVNENSKTGTTVGTFHALDHDEVQSLKFILDDDASGKFTVGSSVTCHNNTYIPGVKTKCTTLLKVNGILDYETSSSEDTLVRVTDDSGLFRVQPFKVTILDVNDRPKNITLAGGDTAFIDENLNHGFVGELATIDEDINQTHSYILINNGGWKFILRQNKIFSSFYANLDYETKSEYSIAVRSRDNGTPRLSIDKTFTIQVRDVNERPTDIILLSSSVQENSPRGTLVSKISVSDPDNNGPGGTWQNHTCKMLNIANIPFILNGTSNTLLVAGDLNYEKTKGYNIDLRCRDNGKPPLSVDKAVRVNVTDVNEKPYDISLSNNEVAENTGIVTVGLLDTADPDNEQTVVQTFSYTIVSPAGNIPFVIVSDALNTSRSLDYETKTSWLLEIKSTDNKGLSTTKNFIIIVRDRNDPPTGISVSRPLNVPENSVSGQYLGTVVTSDQDVGQKHQYQIVDVVGHAHGNRSTSGLLNLFAVESPSGKFTLQKSGLDYEQHAKYTVTLNSTDSGFPSYSVTGSFVVSVHNINENPQNISLSNNQILENSPVGTFIGNMSVYDPDNLNVPLQKFNCVVEDGGPFKVINHLTLVVSRNSLDYETIDTYTVNVTCTEFLSNPLSVSTVFLINVQDVNEAPYNLTISSQSVSENQETGYFVGMLSVLDPDLPTSGFASISLALRDQSPGPDAFQLINSSLVTTRMLDFENQSTYTLTVVATDSGNPPLSTSPSFTIQVIDTNDRPTGVSLLSDGIYENATAGTVVGILRAHDQDVNQSYFFTVKDTDWFAVSGNNLLLSNFSLDYETTPEINVTIEATDNGSPPYSKEDVVSIKVLDSNDRPSEIILNSSLSIPDNVSYTVVIPENSPSGTSLTNLSVVDEDVEQQHRCMLLEGGNNFYISSLSKSSSEIRVKQGANLDYESLRGAPLQVTVNCVDNGNPPYSIQRSFSVQVSDVNEAPFDLRFYGATVIQENVQVGYIVGNVTCKDPDIGQKHIFTVIGHYSSVFQVNTSGNQLYVINSSFLNYEALHVPALLLVSIQATDAPVEQTGPPLHVISDVNISVVDVNEPPTDIRLIPDNISIPENVSIGYCIAQITSSNPERSQKVNYTLLHHQDTFAIKDTCDNNSSVVNDAKGDLPYLTVKSHLSYNYYRIYEVLIEAEDNGIPPLSFNGTVDVNVTKIDPCWSLPCQENSKCRRVDWQNYTCPCNAGYSGDGRVNCYEIDECLSSPCGNGTCHDYVNYYNCTCPSGYYNGMSCSNMINFCLSNPCQNNATCWVHLNGYNCSCVLGFTGLHCETNIDDCASEPCTEGVCVDGINQFTCNCSGSGVFGTRCQRKLGVNRENKDSPLTDNKHFMNKRLYYVIGATGGLLFVVFAVSLLLCRRNSLSAKERRLIRSQRFSDNTDDETYTDAMYRHHMANQETENAGAINPIYGTNEEGANVTTLDNPICQEPDQKNGTPHVKRSESTTGFENSMYFRFRPGKEEEEGGEEEEDKDDFKEEKDGAKSPTGFANPMFSLYKQPKTEAGASGDAVPVKQEKKAAKNKGTLTYETPKKKKKPANEELQVVETCSFFNPLYKTRAQVEEPEKKLDEELPGESDC